MSVEVEIAKAIVSTLRADAGVSSLLPEYRGVKAVFTTVPQKFKDFPYVVLFDAPLNSDDNSESICSEGSITLHTWSDSRDLAVVGNIQKAIKSALNYQDLSLGDYGLIDIHQEFITILRDPDGVTLHGVQRFKIFINEG